MKESFQTPEANIERPKLLPENTTELGEEKNRRELSEDPKKPFSPLIIVD
jgi:hypothetical protein